MERTSQGTEGSIGAFRRGPDLFGVQGISPREFMRIHQEE